MRTDRLIQLIALLETVPPEHFNIGAWKCGTAGCAIGWAAQDPGFIEQGLHLENVYEGVVEPVYWIGDERLDNFDAVEVFFELTQNQAFHLFASHAYNEFATPQDVINRIKELL